MLGVNQSEKKEIESIFADNIMQLRKEICEVRGLISSSSPFLNTSWLGLDRKKKEEKIIAVENEPEGEVTIYINMCVVLHN